MQTVTLKGQYIQRSKESYLIYLTIWVLRLLCGCQVFCEDLNSNSVFKLFILIWSYEGMKVMNFGFVKSNGKLSITPKFDVFIMLAWLFSLSFLGLWQETRFCTVSWMYWYEWHSLCSYVCIGQKYSVSKLLFCLLICMYWLSKTTTPSQSEIFSLCWHTNKQLDRIFHFVRVCWSWKANTYIWGERTTALRQNISGEYTHMSRERERNRWISCLLIVRKTASGLPFQNCGSLTVCQTGNDDVWLCDWIFKTLHK